MICVLRTLHYTKMRTVVQVFYDLLGKRNIFLMYFESDTTDSVAMKGKYAYHSLILKHMPDLVVFE